jgi:hypothetical protein
MTRLEINRGLQGELRRNFSLMNSRKKGVMGVIEIACVYIYDTSNIFSIFLGWLLVLLW